MVVSHKFKYVFIEVPSTGSTAISAELVNYYAGEKILRKHANFTEFRELYPREAREYFVFATVRNPLDMIVTEYTKMKGNHKEQYTTPKFFERNGGFVPDLQLEWFKFIQSGDAEFSDFFRRYRAAIYHNWFLVCHDRFDYIMRFENLTDEFAKALELIGIEAARPLQKVNKTRMKDRRFDEYYDETVHNLAWQAYGPFMRQWGYEPPEGWQCERLSVAESLKYRAKEMIVNSAGRFMTISPFSPTVQRIKSIVDAIV